MMTLMGLVLAVLAQEGEKKAPVKEGQGPMLQVAEVDTNGDGWLSAAELKAALGKLGGGKEGVKKAGAEGGDGVKKKEGPRDGENPKKIGPKDGEGVKKAGPKDGEGPKKEGPKDGEGAEKGEK